MVAYPSLDTDIQPICGSVLSSPKTYVARKRAEGKSGSEAIRCLKRQLARQVFKVLQEGAAIP